MNRILFMNCVSCIQNLFQTRDTIFKQRPDNMDRKSIKKSTKCFYLKKKMLLCYAFTDDKKFFFQNYDLKFLMLTG